MGVTGEGGFGGDGSSQGGVRLGKKGVVNLVFTGNRH